MPITTPKIDPGKYSTTLTEITLIVSLFALAACSNAKNSPVTPMQAYLTATSFSAVIQPQASSISPTATLKSRLLEPNDQGNHAPKGTDNASCSPGTNIVQGTIIVPVMRSDMAETQYHFILPDGTLIGANEIPDGMCAAATGPVDECTGLAVGAVGFDFEDTGLPLVECSQLQPNH